MAKQNKAKSPSPAVEASRVVSFGELDISPTDLPDVAPVAFANYVRALVQGQRQGTVASKSRGQVAFSNKKPWKQKGTGRARAGSRRSPLWRKGGTIFGPQPRIRELKVARGTKTQTLASLLKQGIEQGRVIALDFALNEGKPSTSRAAIALKNAQVAHERVILFVSPEDTVTHASFSNIPHVHMLLFDQPNAYALASSDYWIFLSKDQEAFKKMVSSWI